MKDGDNMVVLFFLLIIFICLIIIMRDSENEQLNELKNFIKSYFRDLNIHIPEIPVTYAYITCAGAVVIIAILILVKIGQHIMKFNIGI